jgi:hypothetical protein
VAGASGEPPTAPAKAGAPAVPGPAPEGSNGSAPLSSPPAAPAADPAPEAAPAILEPAAAPPTLESAAAPPTFELADPAPTTAGPAPASTAESAAPAAARDSEAAPVAPAPGREAVASPASPVPDPAPRPGDPGPGPAPGVAADLQVEPAAGRRVLLTDAAVRPVRPAGSGEHDVLDPHVPAGLPIAGPAGGSPGPAPAERAAGSPAAAVARVLEAVERLAAAPPPRQMVVELPQLGGLRVLVEARGTTVVLRPLGGDGPSSSAFDALARDVGTALASRGFDLSSSWQRERRDEREDAVPPPSRPEPTARSRRAEGLRL